MKNKARLARVVNQAGKMIDIKQLQLCDLYQQDLRRKLLSGRRLRMPSDDSECP